VLNGDNPLTVNTNS